MKGTSITQGLLGKVVGMVQIVEPFTRHNASYECAAWWEDMQAVPGIYPLVLKERAHSQGEIHLVAQVDAKVIDDYFPSLWAGSAIGTTPYKAKHTGEDRIIHVAYTISEAMEATSNSPDSKTKNLFLAKEYWQTFIDEATASFNDCCKDFPKWYEVYASDETRKPYSIGMVAHVAAEITALGRDIEAMERSLGYQNTTNTDSWRRYYDTNTRWAQDMFRAMRGT